MKMPVIEGLIRRRILVNFRVDPEVIQRQLPPGFRPKLHGNYAIAGICLIRLEQIRPKHLPAFVGHSSENAAHRITVRWDDQGVPREGVFIPRRDTNSVLNHVAGGRLFPGEHLHSRFEVQDSEGHIRFSMNGDDEATRIELTASETDALDATSCFSSLSEASGFLQPGSVGYSVTRDKERLDGIRLNTKSWKIAPLRVERVFSSYFADETKFPKGTVNFDCALIMRDIPHEWQGEPDLYV